MLMRMNRLNRANTTGDHDGLVITTSLSANGLLKDSEVTTQVWSSKLIIKCGSTNWSIDHDLQWGRNTLRLAIRTFLPGEVRARNMQVRYGKSGEACFGFTANTRCAFISDLTTRSGRCPLKRCNRSGMVMGLHLH